MVEPDQLEKPRCTSCSSVDILRDAWAVWDMDTQQWVLHSTYDEFRCENCSAEAKRVDFLI
jgi:hypothetical protein